MHFFLSFFVFLVTCGISGMVVGVAAEHREQPLEAVSHHEVTARQHAIQWSLLLAVKKGDAVAIRNLIKVHGANPHHIYSSGRNLLHYAAAADAHDAVILALVEQEVDATVLDASGLEPWQLALSHRTREYLYNVACWPKLD